MEKAIRTGAFPLLRVGKRVPSLSGPKHYREMGIVTELILGDDLITTTTIIHKSAVLDGTSNWQSMAH